MNETLAVEIEETELVRIWDAAKLGRIIGGAIVRGGYDRMADLVLDMERRTGVRRHENTLYNVKNGKTLPDLELLTALMLTLNIKQSELVEAVAEEYRDKYRSLCS